MMFAGMGHTSHLVAGTSVPSGCRAAAARHQTTRLSMSCQLCGDAKGPATFASSSRSSIAFASLHLTTWHGKREVFYILCPASSLMNVPRYVNPDKLMNVPIEHICLQATVLNCPPNNSGPQGIAEQRYMASMQTGQDMQQTNSIQSVAVLSLAGE